MTDQKNVSVFQRAGLPADPSQFKASIAQARAAAPVIGSGDQYLKMNQHGMPNAGEITYGVEGIIIDPKSEWVMNTWGLSHGFLLREGATVHAEVMGPITEPLPSVAGFEPPPKKGQEWAQAYKAQFVCVFGEDVGVTVEFGGAAGGVIKLFKTVILPHVEAQVDKDSARMLPALQFKVHSYYSNKQKKDIYEMQGTIVDWYSDEELVDVVGESVQAVRAQDTQQPAEPEPEPEFVIEVAATGNPRARSGRAARGAASATPETKVEGGSAAEDVAEAVDDRPAGRRRRRSGS